MKRLTAQPKVIDWQQVRQRLARAVAATEESLHLSPERARAVLDERARTLARVPAAALRAADILEVVTFSLGSERYAIQASHVREVVRVTEHTPIPGSPDFLMGVINLRGDIVALLDLRPFFGLGPQAVTDFSRILVLGGERVEFGILVDAAHEVLRLRLDEILEPPGELTSAGRQFLRGVTADALIVLDGSLLLRDQRLFIELDS